MIDFRRLRNKQPHIGHVLLLLIILPLIILAFTQNCSPMKAKLKSNGSSALEFSSDICAPQYKPKSTLFYGKAREPRVQTHFEKNKNQLRNAHGDASSKVTSLQNQTIVVVVDGSCTPADGSLSSQALAQNAGRPPLSSGRRALHFTVEEDLTAEDLGALAESDPCVVGIADDGKIYKSAYTMLVNDPRAGDQIYLQADFSHAYEYLIKKQNSNFKARVGFIDTGADCTHPDLQGNLVSGCGYDATVNAGTPNDQDGHGSHTMGMVGAVMNNNIGITGLAGNSVELHAIRVMIGGNTPGEVVDFYDGVQYAIEQHLDVINISMESPGPIAMVETAVEEAVQAGIVVVMAAGNEGKELMTEKQISPADVGKSLQGAITVGSIDASSGQLSSFSNYGSYVEVLAIGANDSNFPGDSTLGGVLSLDKNGGYHSLMGTSQATPVITAAAAVAVQFLKQNHVSFTNADIERIIEASTAETAGLSATNGGSVINPTILVRSIYAFAGLSLCTGDR